MHLECLRHLIEVAGLFHRCGFNNRLCWVEIVRDGDNREEKPDKKCQGDQRRYTAMPFSKGQSMSAAAEDKRGGHNQPHDI